jgi:protein TonB
LALGGHARQRERQEHCASRPVRLNRISGRQAMFEDSTFESTGRIRTRSRRWMIAALVFNSSILLALILIPLIYPEALQRQTGIFLMEAPPLPPVTPPPPLQTVHPFRGAPEIQDGHIFAPSKIPTTYKILDAPEGPPVGSNLAMDTGIPDGAPNIFHSQAARPIVHPDVKTAVRLSAPVVAGLLLNKTLPVYPPIAKAIGMQGTVVLEAVISKSGTIENLHVVSGPAVLQQAALDAVKTWRYRPYLLDGQPVEVETTVNVVFTMNR